MSPAENKRIIQEIFAALGRGTPLDPVADAGTAFRGGRAMLRLGFELV